MLIQCFSRLFYLIRQFVFFFLQLANSSFPQIACAFKFAKPTSLLFELLDEREKKRKASQFLQNTFQPFDNALRARFSVLLFHTVETSRPRTAMPHKHPFEANLTFSDISRTRDTKETTKSKTKK